MFKWLIVLLWYKFSWTFMVRQQKWTALGTQQSQGRLAQNKAHAHCETFWTAWVLVFQLWVHVFCILDLIFVVTQCSSSNRPTLSRSANGKKLRDCWIVADFRSVWMADSAADPVCETDRNLEQTESKNKELIRWTAFFLVNLQHPWGSTCSWGVGRPKDCGAGGWQGMHHAACGTAEVSRWQPGVEQTPRFELYAGLRSEAKLFEKCWALRCQLNLHQQISPVPQIIFWAATL